MAGEWQEIPLSQIAKLRSGFPFKSASWTDSGVPVIKIANIKGGRIVPDGCGYVSPDTASTVPEWETREGDVLIAMTGYVGEIALVRPGEKYLINQRVGRFEFLDSARVIPKFLFFYLSQPEVRSLLETMARGSAQPNLSARDIELLRVPVPPIAEQRAIAHILGTLDDKIELNRKQNETLEAMARALFKDWFVDFGPVRAKMEGREPYLPADLWQLFPDRLDDEGKPEGWEDDCLGSFTNIKNGYAFKSKDWCEAGVPVVKIGSVKPSFVDISQVSFIDVTLAREKESFRLNVGDMLVGLTGYVGETGRIPPTDNRPMLNQRVGKFEPFDSLEPFVFACVRMPDFKVFAESKAHGSAQANVSTTELLKYPVVNPGRELLEAFCRMLEPLFLKSLANEGEQATLSRLRDTLLPKLISGELRIADAEKFLERLV